MSLSLRAPQPLTPEHLLDGFTCGEPTLDHWLKHRAMANHLTGASRTFVVTDQALHVLGYYALAAGAVARQGATGPVRRNMPDPIPVMVLGRLAVDQRAQGMGLGLGAGLLQDALHRTLAVSENVGVRALLVHALHEEARAFYTHHGFQPSPLDPITLMLRVEGVRQA